MSVHFLFSSVPKAHGVKGSSVFLWIRPSVLDVTVLQEVCVRDGRWLEVCVCDGVCLCVRLYAEEPLTAELELNTATFINQHNTHTLHSELRRCLCSSVCFLSISPWLGLWHHFAVVWLVEFRYINFSPLCCQMFHWKTKSPSDLTPSASTLI